MGKMGGARQSQTVALQNEMSNFMRVSLTLSFVAVAGLAPCASATETKQTHPNGLFTIHPNGV
jgi:hypothetical protein